MAQLPDKMKFNGFVYVASISGTDEDALSSVDCQDLNSKAVVLHLGTATNVTATNDITWEVQDSDDGTTFADVDADLIDNDSSTDAELFTLSENIAANAHRTVVVRVNSGKRYLRVGHKRGGGTATCAYVAAVGSSFPMFS